MGINIGLDIGAISLKLAALGKPQDRPVLESLCAARPDFRLAELDGARWSSPTTAASPAAPSNPPTTCCRNSTKPSPKTASRASASPVPAAAPSPRSWACFSRTSSKPSPAPWARFTRRCARCSKSAGKAPNTSAWKAPASWITTAPGECAAGTGSFLDQQALRMQYSVEEMGEVVLHGQLRGAHRRALLGVRQERHDPRPAEGLLAGRDPARPVRRGGAQFQELHRQGPAGGGAGGADWRGIAERGRNRGAARGVFAWPKTTCWCPPSTPGRGHRRGHPGSRGAAQALDSGNPPPAPARRRGARTGYPPAVHRKRGPVARPRGRLRAAAEWPADSRLPGPRYRLGVHQRGGHRRIRRGDPRRLSAHRRTAHRSRAAGAGGGGAPVGQRAWRSAAWAPPARGAS